MPLIVEVKAPWGQSWNEAGRLHPGQPSGSMSHNKEDGKREIYMFACVSDLESKIHRSEEGVDTEVNAAQRLTLSTRFELVTILRDGDPPYEMAIKTDRSPKVRHVRFLHKNG